MRLHDGILDQIDHFSLVYVGLQVVTKICVLPERNLVRGKSALSHAARDSRVRGERYPDYEPEPE